MDSFVGQTPKVLTECLDLLRSPMHEVYINSPTTSQRYSKHPNIKYFQKIKAKNHFDYHKSKSSKVSIEKIHSKKTIFDPYSREGLLGRLRTFTALNWNVPEIIQITELTCCRNGWKCLSSSLNRNTKNHLVCTSCNQQLILKFNNESSEIPFEFDIEDYNALNLALADQYIKQIKRDGHNSNCSWRSFEAPLEGVYYLRPYLSNTNDYLINEYLSALKNLIDNVEVIDKNKICMKDVLIAIEEDERFDRFVKISNFWLVNRYFKDNKENFTSITGVPHYIYKLAILGWNLKVQSFSGKLVPLFICANCNARYLLNLVDVKNENDMIATKFDLNLSSSNILTPCENPITLNYDRISLYDFCDNNFEDEFKFDIVNEHKEWCCIVKDMDQNLPYLQYFITAVLDTATENGINDMNKGVNLETEEITSKRKKNFEINDGLERLRKLRKLFLDE